MHLLHYKALLRPLSVNLVEISLLHPLPRGNIQRWLPDDQFIGIGFL